MSPRVACRLEELGFTKVYDYVNGIADWKAAGLPTEGLGDGQERVADATRSDVPACRPEEPISTVRSRVVDAGWRVCVVVDCDGLVVGQIRPPALDEHDEIEVQEVMVPGPSTVRPDQLLQQLLARMIRRNSPHVLVTTPEGMLIGILLRDEAERLLAGEPSQQIWRNCEGCPGRWASAFTGAPDRDPIES